MSGSDDRTVRVWAVKIGRAVAGPFEEHTWRVTVVAFSPNGKQVISSLGDKTVRIYRMLG